MKKALNTSVLVTADSPKGQRATETFRAQYNKAELTEEKAQLLNESPGFAVYIHTGIKRFATKAPDYGLIRAILGKDFISPEEVMNSRDGITYTGEQLARFRETVPAQKILEQCRGNNFMLIAGPNHLMPLLEIRCLNNDYFREQKAGWYDDKKFALIDKAETRWYMIRKNIIIGSISKNWKEQQILISDVETVPNIAEFTWGVTTYKAVRGVYLFREIYVRTSSLESRGNLVIAGRYDGGGLDICSMSNNIRDNNIGLSTSMESDT